MLKEKNSLVRITSEYIIILKKQNFYDSNNKLEPVGVGIQESFIPSMDLTSLKNFAPEFVELAQNIWTKEVVLSYESVLKEQQNIMNNEQY